MGGGQNGYNRNQWIVYDLKQEMTIDKLKIDMPAGWYLAEPNNFELQYAAGIDGPWTAALTAVHPGLPSAANTDFRVFTFSGVTARYWRLYMHDEHGYGYIVVQYIQFGNSAYSEGTYDDHAAIVTATSGGDGGPPGGGSSPIAKVPYSQICAVLYSHSVCAVPYSHSYVCCTILTLCTTPCSYSVLHHTHTLYSSPIAKPGAPDNICWGGTCNGNFTNGCRCPLAPPAEGSACEWRSTYFRSKGPVTVLPSVTITRTLGYAADADSAVLEEYSHAADVSEAVITIVANAETMDVLGLQASLVPVGVTYEYSISSSTDELTGVVTPVPVLTITPVPGSGEDVVPEATILYALRALQFSSTSYAPSKDTRELSVAVTYVDGQRTMGKAWVMFPRPLEISNLHGALAYKPSIYSEDNHLAHA
jgi:hypothetical protein